MNYCGVSEGKNDCINNEIKFEQCEHLNTKLFKHEHNVINSASQHTEVEEKHSIKTEPVDCVNDSDVIEVYDEIKPEYPTSPTYEICSSTVCSDNTTTKFELTEVTPNKDIVPQIKLEEGYNVVNYCELFEEKKEVKYESEYAADTTSTIQPQLKI